MAKTLATQIGDYFEGVVKDALKVMAARTSVCWYRLSDTGSAGGRAHIGSQPADFLLASCKQAVMLEVKASATHDDLTKSLMRPAQRLAIHQWSVENELPYLVLFWSFDTGIVQLWDGKEVLSADRKLNKERALLGSTEVGEPGSWSVDKLALAQLLLDNIPAVPVSELADVISLAHKKWNIAQ